MEKKLSTDLTKEFPIHAKTDENHEITLMGSVKEKKGTSSQFLFSLTPKSQKDVEEILPRLRKNQHIDLCQNSHVESSDRFTGFNDVSLIPEAVPELSLEDLNSEITFLNKKIAAPILITGMTGGTEKGYQINRNLAFGAAKLGIPMGVGSQRLALEKKEYQHIFQMKKDHPDLFLIGNIGFT